MYIVLETGYAEFLFLLHAYNLFSFSLQMECNDVWLIFCLRHTYFHLDKKALKFQQHQWEFQTLLSPVTKPTESNS